MTDTVQSVMGQLTDGQIDIDTAATALEGLPPTPAPPEVATFDQVEGNPDSDVMAPDSVGHIEAAYTNGDITLEQYERLAAAAMGTAA